MVIYPSPLKSLTAYAVAFLSGVLTAVGLSRYIRKVRDDAVAAERARHEARPPQPPADQS